MDKNLVDHLVLNNPYERFMIMIMDRLDKIENRMDNIDNKMSVVMGNLTTTVSNLHIIFKITLEKQIDVEAIDTIYNFLYKELGSTQCFFL